MVGIKCVSVDVSTNIVNESYRIDFARKYIQYDD